MLYTFFTIYGRQEEEEKEKIIIYGIQYSFWFFLIMNMSGRLKKKNWTWEASKREEKKNVRPQKDDSISCVKVYCCLLYTSDAADE